MDARLGIAAGNQLGAQAGANVARQGGNAVDACIASCIMAWVAEPFFVSIGGSGFIAVRTPDGGVEVVDGNNTMPLNPPTTPGQAIERTYLDYSNGMYTGIGAGSVGVPGILAAAHTVWERHGKIEWPALFEDAIGAAREGVAFPKTSAYYLSVTWDAIWSKFEEARALFSDDGGRPLVEGAALTQPELAEALEVVAEQGPDAFYRGELARELADALADGDGLITLDDLEQYTAEIRAPISTQAFGWKIESNPPPSVGGAVLVHMLALLDEAKLDDPLERLRAIVEAQRAAVGYRLERYQDPGAIASAFEEALETLRAKSRAMRSPSTTHASAADRDGYACSITASNGYGSGLVVHGMALNNTLGEEELNPLGVHRLPPGSRCHSNMSPTIASGPDQTVALGSPGADRIVSAIVQTFLRIAVDGESLADAVAAPRAHLDPRRDGELLCYELDLPGAHLGYTPRHYDEIHMYFGAVQAASVTSDGKVDAAFDPRRSGGSALV
ncbi:MAG TPA: gamma-glutamyltransferase [Actinomycetota bacterium]|nr:gamma-glutamyltransferase [Actinomycetota bacterium]